jgi:hypothetical protein
MLNMMSNKIYVSQDDHEIIDYITDAGIRHTDDDQHRVFTFLLNDNYHLVIYFASPGDKGFLMFKIDDIKNNISEVGNLKKMLLESLKSGNNISLLNSAIRQVEDMELAGLAAEIFKENLK